MGFDSTQQCWKNLARGSLGAQNVLSFRDIRILSVWLLGEVATETSEKNTGLVQWLCGVAGWISDTKVSLWQMWKAVDC